MHQSSFCNLVHPHNWFKVNTDDSFWDVNAVGSGGVNFMVFFASKLQVSSAIDAYILVVIEII